MASNINITVQATDRKFTVVVPSDISVSAFKRRIQADVGCEPSLHRLIHRGRILEDDKSFSFYGILDGHNVHFVKGGGGSSQRAPVAPPPPTSTMPPQVPPFGMGGRGGLGGLGGMGNMAEMQEELRRNPQMMEEMMNSPMMQTLMDNPDLMQSVVTNNPQLQALMNSNPELRHALTDPAALRQSMQMMRNPQAMQQMQRSQELAMSQLENHPGGFQHLRRMYTDVMEPMNDAMSASPTPSTPSAPVSREGALPNPWASPSAPSAPTNQSQRPVFSAPTGSSGNGMGGLFGAGMGGGMSGIPGMFPGTPTGGMNSAQNAVAMNALRNPAIRQMMSQMMSDPNTIQQISTSNPELGQMMQNPMLRNMLSDPNFLESIAQMGGSGNAPDLGSGIPPGFPMFGVPPPTSNAGLAGLDFSSMLGAMGVTTATPAATSTSTTPIPSTTPSPLTTPAVRFADQQAQLQSMGFTDASANLQALVRTNGNINAAVERLLGS